MFTAYLFLYVMMILTADAVDAKEIAGAVNVHMGDKHNHAETGTLAVVSI